MPARMRGDHPYALEERVLLSSAGHSRLTAGALASARWLRTLGQTPPLGEWNARLELIATSTTSFTLEICHSEWSFEFRHAARRSAIRVASLPAVHEHDDFKLLLYTPALQAIGGLVRRLEREHEIGFRRSTACIETSVPALVPDALRWIAQL
jgi:hypothetical protein